MIPCNDAKKLISVGTNVLPTETISIKNCIGYCNATDIFSPINFPDFPQAAMDGYAVFLPKNKRETNYEIITEIQAGNTEEIIIEEKQAARIFTGAKVPTGANAVIQQEWTDRKENTVAFGDYELKEGMNIRPAGSQTKKGELVLKKGTALTPGCISMLAGLGLDTIAVHKKPKVAIITTGKELVAPGNKIMNGQIYESNSYSLVQALAQLHIQPEIVMQIDDDFFSIKEKIKALINEVDLLLITGGVSVGDYDFVAEALHQNGVEKIFHKVKQKPGKPLYSGRKEKVTIFGLPGNPASVLTCYYQYVIPSIKKMMGFVQTELTQILLPCKNNFEKKAGLTHFLKGKLHADGVEILPHQESYKMNTFAIADALIEIQEDCTKVSERDLVNVYLL